MVQERFRWVIGQKEIRFFFTEFKWYKKAPFQVRAEHVTLRSMCWNRLNVSVKGVFLIARSHGSAGAAGRGCESEDKPLLAWTPTEKHSVVWCTRPQTQGVRQKPLYQAEREGGAVSACATYSHISSGFKLTQNWHLCSSKEVLWSPAWYQPTDRKEKFTSELPGSPFSTLKSFAFPLAPMKRAKPEAFN